MRDVLPDVATRAADELDQPLTGEVLQLIQDGKLQVHYRIAVNVLLETAQEDEWSRTSAAAVVDSVMGYTVERSTDVFEAASARAKPHENREAECVRDEERTKLNLRWLHWLRENSRLLYH